MDNESYYDVMSEGYENERHMGYHVFLDNAEVKSVLDLVRGKEVLEVGCGTGLILSRLAPIASRVVGVDLSAGMLEKARARGLTVVQANALALPFPDASFDVAVSFKVLAHIEDIRGAVSEMCRVVKPGGYVAAEFYNKHSIRSLIKYVKKPSPIGKGVADTDVYTRYDSLKDAASYFPAGMEVVRVRGIRTVIPTAAVMKIPGLDSILGWQDGIVGRTPFGRLGGFLVVIARKK
jgi:ubiquinone/menaquinone biosynthesis C-methylase UbiE